jgi:hypothetical protein
MELPFYFKILGRPWTIFAMKAGLLSDPLERRAHIWG